QTPESLRTYVLEEAYEVLEALDAGDPAEVREELGDLLFQVVFQARIFEERGAFDLAGVARAIAAKLVRRHPHVFGDEADRSHAAISRRWEDIKAAERRAKLAAGAAAAADHPAPAAGSTLDGVPRALPALARAQK